jgi:hypothetical protein
MTMAMTVMMMALEPPMTQSQAVNREQCSTSCVLQGTSDLFLGYLTKKLLSVHFENTLQGENENVLIYRAPQCMSPRRNWDSPNPFLQAIVPSPPPD